MRFATVLFDLDGTLTDSEAGIAASYRCALAAVGLTAEQSAIRSCIGPPLRHSLSRLGVPAEDLEPAVAVFREYLARQGMYESQLYDGVVELLGSLRAAGTVMGVATSKVIDIVAPILEHFEILEYFATVSGATADGQRLHKVDIAAHALADLGSPHPSTVALVGDREHDMFAASELGLFAIGAAWGYGGEEELVRSGASVLVAQPAALAAVLLGL